MRELFARQSRVTLQAALWVVCFLRVFMAFISTFLGRTKKTGIAQANSVTRFPTSACGIRDAAAIQIAPIAGLIGASRSLVRLRRSLTVARARMLQPKESRPKVGEKIQTAASLLPLCAPPTQRIVCPSYALSIEYINPRRLPPRNPFPSYDVRPISVRARPPPKVSRATS